MRALRKKAAVREHINAPHVQKEVQTETAGIAKSTANRRGRRHCLAENRRLNNRIKTLAAAGLPASLVIGPTGRLEVRVDLRAMKKREEAEAEARTGVPIEEVVTEVSGGTVET
jgi:hypothetical protein